MASHRCAHCDAFWPAIKLNEECPGCGRQTWPVSDMPDKSYHDATQARAKRTAWATTDEQPTQEIEVAGTQRVSGDYLHEHRVERFQALGFSEVFAEALAEAKDALGFPLYWGDIRAALAAGCTHEQAIVIYT